MLVRSLETFSEKKSANCWAIDVTDDKFGRDGEADFHLCSSLWRVFVRIFSAGLNQGFSFGEWVTLVMRGACLSRMRVSVVL